MYSIDDLQLVSLLLYAWLLGCVAWGRPRLRELLRSRTRDAPPAATESFPPALEVLWLASVAVVVLFPLGALLGRSVVLSSVLTVRFPGDEIAQTIGIAMVLVAGALVAGAFRALGRFATVEIRLGPDHQIVRSGPYRWIRHPMYTANMLLSVGIALVFLSLPVLAPLLVIFILSFVRARAEEDLFLDSARLNSEYSTYRAATGRFLPLVLRRAGRSK